MVHPISQKSSWTSPLDVSPHLFEKIQVSPSRGQGRTKRERCLCEYSDQNMPIPRPRFRSRSRVFPAGEGFNDHAASSPPPSQPAYLRRQRGHFYPPPLSAFGTLRAHSASPLSPPSISPLITLGGWNAFITRPFSLQTFGIGE